MWTTFPLFWRINSCNECRVAHAGEIPSFKLIETKHVYSFLDIQPTSQGHALVIPKWHGAKLHDIPDEYLHDVLPTAKKIAKALNLDADGNYNILQNNGRLAHQEVDHVHFHLIPKPDEKTGLIVGWPAKQADMDQLAKFHKELVAKLESWIASTSFITTYISTHFYNC